MPNEYDPITISEAQGMREFSTMYLTTAKHVAETQYPTPYEVVCFMCAQAAEDAVKGVIIKLDIEAPKTHMIDQLLDILTDLGIEVPEELFRQASDLSPFTTKMRYPSPIPVEKHHMDYALKCAVSIYSWCEKFWK